MSVQEADSTLAALYKGVFPTVPTAAAPPATGKDVWVISCGEAFPACATITSNIKEAGGLLGWNVTIADSAGNSSQYNTIVKQAVAAKADAVIDISGDCPNLKSGLESAKAANVPVIAYGALDCDNPAFEGDGSPLFAAVQKMLNSDDVPDYYATRAKASADYIAATLAKKGVTGGDVLAIDFRGQAVHEASFTTLKAELAKTCPDCNWVDVPFTLSQVPNPAAQIWKTQILAHPSAVAVVYDSNSWLPAGLLDALKAARTQPDVVCCGEAANFELEAIRAGTVTAASLWSYAYDGWAIADTTNWVLNGSPAGSLPAEAGGYQFIDAEHNLPAEGTDPAVPFDYKAQFTARWTGN